MPSIPEVLRTSKTIAVVGLSANPLRVSHSVAQYLQGAGYRIIPVNPNVTEVLGERCYPSLDDVPEPIDIVNVFRRSEFVSEVADAAIRIQARCLWLQEGVIHEDGAERARQAGLFVVMDRCTLKEHRKLFR